ncbi:L-gulono-1,4-lactone dehydrogenase [Pseudoruegeria aquimaris]|uniref:L-gulono-1,4-lactone dehydrogenase n=1 Tax=Pseudoruegeria aquimaris TaxID=393663 RepID=A0A1Y5RZT4_9RHOB|nr:D-arabinono-1,4-lactone oxidase [Pseudoruegeria aquimaris]SLN28741.1 L-gulono-1,4-lactone dehydrogenase [Pseudoruegeria aquimaris]
MAHHWSNWSGGVVAQPAQILDVADEAALAAAIRSAAVPVRPVGSGHSFSPVAAVPGGTLLRLAGFDHVEPLADGDDGARHVRVGAGITLGALTERLHAMGHALANMGDIDDQTVGGALGTATHGTGAAFGCYPSMLEALTLIDGMGNRRMISRAEEPELFKAMAVGIGTGGVVTEAVIRTVAPYRLERSRYALPIGDMLADFEARMAAARNVEFYYITGSGQALVMESRETEGDLVARPPDRDQEGLRQLRLAAKLTRAAPRLRRFALGLALKGHVKEHFVEDWHKAFPTDRDGIRFNESEYHLPAEAAPEALKRVIERVERNFRDVYFPMEVRTVAPDDLWLSPFFERPTVSIAVHHEAGRPFGALLAEIETIFADYEGRPHWGKMHGLKAGQLRKLYPKWDEAIAARRELDPKGLFLTPYMRELLGQ